MPVRRLRLVSPSPFLAKMPTDRHLSIPPSTTISVGFSARLLVDGDVSLGNWQAIWPSCCRRAGSIPRCPGPFLSVAYKWASPPPHMLARTDTQEVTGWMSCGKSYKNLAALALDKGSWIRGRVRRVRDRGRCFPALNACQFWPARRNAETAGSSQLLPPLPPINGRLERQAGKRSEFCFIAGIPLRSAAFIKQGAHCSVSRYFGASPSFPLFLSTLFFVSCLFNF